MQRNRMVAVFLGVVGVLVGAYMIVNRNGALQQAIKKNDAPSLDGAPATVPLEDGSGLSEWAAGLFADGAGADKGNATKNIATVAFEQMKALDQEGRSPFNEANASATEVQDAVERSIGESAALLFDSAAVRDSELKISANNTRDAKRRYLSELESLLAKHPAKKEYGAIEGGLQGLVEASCVGEQVTIGDDIAKNYQAIADGIKALQVPSQWLESHRQMIMYYRQGEIIFSAIANCYNDPLKGFSAAQLLSEFVTNSSLLQNSLEKMYTEVGL